MIHSRVVPPEADPRASPRHTAVLMLARLILDQDDYLCRLRNISVDGALIELPEPPAAGTRVQIETRAMKAVDARIVWARADRAGLRFADPITIESMLSGMADRRGATLRAPRLLTRARVSVRQGYKPLAATLTDISPRGCRLRPTGTLTRDNALALTIEGLGMRAATVRWTREGEAGLQFLTPIGFPELARWLGQRELRFSAIEDGSAGDAETAD
jgi:hypothetical protein